jgi:hypothetical protein
MRQRALANLVPRLVEKGWQSERWQGLLRAVTY